MKERWQKHAEETESKSLSLRETRRGNEGERQLYTAERATEKAGDSIQKTKKE